MSMNTKLKYSALIAAVILVMPYAAYADQGTGEKFSYKRLEIQMTALTCYNNFTTSYLKDVVNVINNATITSSISSTDLPKITGDFASLQTDASANNTSQFKTDAKIYRNDTKIANLDARTAIKTVHDKTTTTTLRTDMEKFRTEYKSCLFGTKVEHALYKVGMFNKSLWRAENNTKRLGLHGFNTAAMNQTINLANNKIKTFESDIEDAKNGTQLKGAMKSFCLYNGCKTPNNFHFGAKMVIDASQAKLNLLATKNSTASYQALVAQAQTDLNNAQTALNQTGSDKYQGTQSNDVWSNIKAADGIIHQLAHIVGFKH